MDREDISRKIQSNQVASKSTREWIERLVDDVVNDFESRTCEGCLFYLSCPILIEFSTDQKIHCFKHGWSCNMWEQKDG